MNNKVLGMGNALVDVLTVLDSDAILQQLHLPKGSMQLIDRTMMDAINQCLASYPKSMVAGGSASNTVNAMAKMGIETGFVGKIGNDEVGAFFLDDTCKNGVTPQLLSSSNESGRCMVLISKDGERTMCTFLGASAEMEAGDLTAELFDGYTIFHIEGYLVQNYDLIRRAISLAKAAGMTISLDMASFNVVAQSRDFLKEIIPGNIDILFANEEEARAFTGEEPRKALDILSAMSDIAIVKVGQEGSFIKHRNEVMHIDSFHVNCIDTTGAGDIYAAGFLYGFATGFSLAMSGKTGSYLAAKVVEEVGSKISAEKWDAIHQWVDALAHGQQS